jgi:hypothetical protein
LRLALDLERFMGLARARQTMEPDTPMSLIQGRTPVSLRLGAAWLFCGLVIAVSACAGGAGDSRADAAPADADVCVPGCTGDGIRACIPVDTVTPCALGCEPGAPACREIVPSNGADRTQLDNVTAELRVPTGTIVHIDTTDGTITDLTNDAVLRDPGEGVANGIGFYTFENGTSVVAVESLAIERDSALLVEGSNTLLLLSDGDATIEGQLDVSACCENDDLTDKVTADRLAGPGGGNGAVPGTLAAQGCAPGVDGNGEDVDIGDETGGGGGGLGSDGAPGGVGGDGTAPGAGGDASSAGCPGPSLVPLRGGSGGGAGGIGAGAGRGGGGGGAVQITSFTRINVLGSPGQFIKGILANGGGGGPGTNTAGGGGGGSGGAILLEAPAIVIEYVVLAANGGGGGGSGDTTEARAGQMGRFDSTQAAGGLGPRAGGRGGASNGGATIGGGGADGTGGGGGGVGIIRFNVPEANLQVNASTISPTFTRGDPQSQ